MKEQSKRIYVTVDPALEEKLDRLKQTDYYAQTHAEMLRDLIELGLRQLTGTTGKTGDPSPR